MRVNDFRYKAILKRKDSTSGFHVDGFIREKEINVAFGNSKKHTFILYLHIRVLGKSLDAFFLFYVLIIN